MLKTKYVDSYLRPSPGRETPGLPKICPEAEARNMATDTRYSVYGLQIKRITWAVSRIIINLYISESICWHFSSNTFMKIADDAKLMAGPTD
jgi:hypothetical protein